MHQNNGNCSGCDQIMNKYPGFSSILRNWVKQVQLRIPFFHVAEAGRGRIDQEKDFAKGASKAYWPESAHNHNAAVDTFFQIDGQYRLDESLYQQVLSYLTPEIEWYGSKGAVFYERPHFQLKGWQSMNLPTVE